MTIDIKERIIGQKGCASIGTEAPKMTVHKKDDKFQLSSMSYRQALRVQILSQIDGSQDPNPYFLPLIRKPGQGGPHSTRRPPQKARKEKKSC